MPSQDFLVQLVTRIPYDLRRRVKIHCTRNDVTLTRFVIEALHERLQTEARRGSNGRRASR